ncbi:MAG: DUF447 family spectrin-like domain-containing protein, partial [Candidatus Hodarchaeales archaeon]
AELFKPSYKLFNRAENLVLEIIILATRLKIAKNDENEPLISKILNKIRDHIKDVSRFGKNESAIKAIEIVNKYISNLL